MARPETHRREANAFTLVELLVVMGVIVTLLSLSVPAVLSLGKASGLNGAGNEVEGLFSKARQNSVSKNVLTAVVVLGDPAAGGSAFHTMTLLQLAVRSDGQPVTTADWQQIEPWHVLPTGIITDNRPPAASPSGSSFFQPITFQPAPPSLRYQSSTVQPATSAGAAGYYYQVFLPNGTLSQQTGPCSLTLVPGYYTGMTAAYTSGQSNYYTIVCTNATGDVKILRP